MNITFRVDDVLQSTLFTSPQLASQMMKPLFSWFKETMDLLQGQNVKLAVVSEGIHYYPEWSSYIKEHPEWKIVCHGLEHKVYKHLPADIAVSSLKVAKYNLEEAFGQEVTEFHLPKLFWHVRLVGLTELAGMQLMNERTTLESWLEEPRDCEVYLHYWNPKDLDRLKQVLKML